MAKNRSARSSQSGLCAFGAAVTNRHLIPFKRQQFDPEIVWTFLDSMGYDMTVPPHPPNLELEAVVLQAFRANETTRLGEYLPPLLALHKFTCAYSEMTYHKHPLEVKAYISIYTALLAAIDDMCEKTPSIMIPQLTQFVTTFNQGPEGLRNPILQHAHRLITTETPKHFGPFAAASIIKGTLDCFLGWVIESRFPCGLAVPKSSSRFPRFLRWKTGDSEAYAMMLFPEAMFPEKQHLGTYFPAIPDLIELFNAINDIMSFYKESVVGTEENTYIMNTARLYNQHPVSALRDSCKEQVQLMRNVTATLGKTNGLKAVFGEFIKGYIMWHATQKRYRLDEIDIQPGRVPRG